MNTIKTDVVSKQVAALIHANGSKFFGVTFIKKDGEERTLNGHVRKVQGHTGHNNASHYEKYVTIVLNTKDKNGKPQFRNVNTETIKALSIGGRKIKFD
uniref:HNH endonuclease n=2 Tax=unclassified bacterial viruses TaxID=12333 RepID=A0AAU6VZI8_9VIRU